MRYIVCFILVIIGISVGLIYNAHFPDNFYDATLVQIVTPILQIATLIAIAVFVNIKLSNSNKKNEIFIEILDSYKEIFLKLHSQATEYISSKDSTLEAKILQLLTSASQEIQILEEISEIQSIYSVKDMQTDLIEYKKRLTNKAFKQDTKYTLIQVKSINSAKVAIIKKLAKAKISLY